VGSVYHVEEVRLFSAAVAVFDGLVAWHITWPQAFAMRNLICAETRSCYRKHNLSHPSIPQNLLCELMAASSSNDPYENVEHSCQSPGHVVGVTIGYTSLQLQMQRSLLHYEGGVSPIAASPIATDRYLS